jgi:iron complex outermembrane receptor protein
LLFSVPVVGQTVVQEEKDTTKTYQVDEVVVTGTRTTKKIIDVPYSVERIKSVEYRFARKVSINDVLSDVPGLFMQDRYGNHDVRISIRGFGSRSNSGIRGVRILLDGIPESEPDGQTRIEALDFHSIGSIEVVKGNASSLYTNAPGGVINFINDVSFQNSFSSIYSDVGSFGLSISGFKTGIKGDKVRFLTAYNYHSSKGFRDHSDDFWHIVNSVLEISPHDFSHLYLYGYYVDGIIRLPGSITKEQFEQDTFQPNQRDVARDTKRITKKGRLGIRYNAFFGEEKQNEVDIIGYGTIKYFERTARTYRLFNRTGVGASARFVNHSTLFDRANEFSVGGDVFYQTGPIEDYNNISGKKGDLLQSVIDEGISNVGFYVSNSYSIINHKLDFLMTGRYDKVLFDFRNLILEAQNDARRFEAFTPKAALNCKITPTIAAFTSYGLGFDTPAGNEIDNYPTSSKPNSMINPDLQPQKSKNFEIGVKGSTVQSEAKFFNKLYFDATFFHLIIDDEIVPFEVFGDVFYRNAARTKRTGLELGFITDIIGGLKGKSSYTFSNFTYDHYTARFIDFDTVGNLVSAERSFTGNVVPSVPKHNLSLTLVYEHEFKETLAGFIKLNNRYVSGLYTNDANTEKTETYNLVHSSIGVDWWFGKTQVIISAGVNNMFDKKYAAFVNINSQTKEYYEAGETRNFFASLNLGYTF